MQAAKTITQILIFMSIAALSLTQSAGAYPFEERCPDEHAPSMSSNFESGHLMRLTLEEVSGDSQMVCIEEPGEDTALPKPFVVRVHCSGGAAIENADILFRNTI